MNFIPNITSESCINEPVVSYELEKEAKTKDLFYVP